MAQPNFEKLDEMRNLLKESLQKQVEGQCKVNEIFNYVNLIEKIDKAKEILSK